MIKKPLLSSMHTHTTFCDGENDIETMCKYAYKKKLFALGFSAHAPLRKYLGDKSWWTIKEERVPEYIKEVQAAKERWHDKLNIYLGFEVDYIKNIRSPVDKDIASLNPDYIIGSVHYVIPKNGADLFTIDGSAQEFEKGLNEGFEGDALSLMNSYYDAQLEMISNGGFEILGHADIIKKNCHNKNYWPEDEELRRQREVAQAALRAGITIEVNTGGINRKKIKDVYPSLSFLRIIREYNIPVIITADAHKVKHINGNYKKALNILKSAGINEHSLFIGKKNGKSIWQKEKL